MKCWTLQFQEISIIVVYRELLLQWVSVEMSVYMSVSSVNCTITCKSQVNLFFLASFPLNFH